MHSGLYPRVFDALIGLRDGRILIGGLTARGLHDDPVVRSMFDAGMLDAVDGKWGLTAKGLDCSEHARAFVHSLSAIETPR